jgi:hypothetical protein
MEKARKDKELPAIHTNVFSISLMANCQLWVRLNAIPGKVD